LTKGNPLIIHKNILWFSRYYPMIIPFLSLNNGSTTD
jgi:hypothetical protein